MHHRQVGSYLVFLVDDGAAERSNHTWRNTETDYISCRVISWSCSACWEKLLTQNKDGEAVEEGAHVGQDPHEHGKLQT